MSFEDGIRFKKISSQLSLALEELTLIFRQNGTYQRYCLKNEIYIGRDERCEVVYTHLAVSNVHAKIYENHGWVIEDLDSKNGVYVNHQNVKKARLQMGDWIVIAGFELYFCECFLCMDVPNKVKLPVFASLPSKEYVEIKKDIILYEPIQKPQLTLPKSVPISIMKEVITPSIYPILHLLFSENPSQMVYFGFAYSGIRLFEGVIRKVNGFIVKRKALKTFSKQCRYYQKNLKLVYLAPRELEKVTYLSRKSSLQVRLGICEEEIVLHDFKQYPHLVIVGKKEEAQKYLYGLLYQLERYCFDLGIVSKEVYLPLVFSPSRLNPKEELFGINEKGKYRIDFVEDLKDCDQSVDAIVNLEEGWYFNTHQVDITFDEWVDDAIFSRLYVECSNHQKTDSLSFMQWCQGSMERLRHQFSIQHSLRGLAGYEDGKAIYLDLHEQKDGPHLLVAGMSGSGKSEWLTSFLLSLALLYDSCDVQFFIIDFKGGGLCQLFEKLHHTTSVLSNLDAYQMHRAIASLEDEINCREQLLLEVSQALNQPILDIHQLKKQYAQKKTAKNLAHLLIVVDEFAELKMLYPEMMQSLIRIARTGRSLGIHLILCTQRPSGIVDRQMESNIQTRICFKVASKQELYDVLCGNTRFFPCEPGQWVMGKGKDFFQGSTLFVDERPATMVLYDLHLNEQSQIVCETSIRSYKAELISQINLFTQKVPRLYPLGLEVTKIPNDVFGLYDDFMHRRLVSFSIPDSLLVIGSHHTSSFPNVHVVKSYLEVTKRMLESVDMVIFFDLKSLEQILYKKVPFNVDESLGLGVLYLKGEIYPCKIRFDVL